MHQSTRGLGSPVTTPIQSNSVPFGSVTSAKISKTLQKEKESCLATRSERLAYCARVVSGITMLCRALLAGSVRHHRNYQQGQSATRGTTGAAAVWDSLRTWARTAWEPAAPIAELLTTEGALEFLLSPQRQRVLCFLRICQGNLRVL